LASDASELAAKLKSVDQNTLHQAVAREAMSRFHSVSAGVDRFTATRKKRAPATQDVLWSEGSASILDYGTGAEDAPLCLFVPSLINQAYIFDLSPSNSMINFFTKQGLNCALLDWGKPTSDEQGFGAEEYINRLIRAIAHLSKKHGKPVHLVGYCMGGLFSIAASQLAPTLVASLSLIATPWDFAAADVKRYQWDANTIAAMQKIFDQGDAVAGELIYYLMYLQSPWAVQDKYARFAGMERDSTQSQNFIERESWVHDCVPMTGAMATDSFINWGIHNMAAKGKWQVGGQTIDPRSITTPAYIAMAADDAVVPLLCASSLVSTMRHAQSSVAPTGHVGMIVGKDAKRLLWLPLASWIKNL
jgi:poly(3-hydroxyalkanoate) synthetase